MNVLLAVFLLLGNSPAMPFLLEGDAAYDAIDYAAADSLYAIAYAQDSTDPGVLWRLARLHVCIGDTVPDDEKIEWYRKAERYARKCIASDDERYEGHTGLAAALGSIAYYSGIGDQVSLAAEMKDELDRALDLNPRDDVAYSILGSFYRALGNTNWFERQIARLFLGSVPDGDFADGELALKRAIALAPRVMRNYYEIGLLYLDWGKSEEAKMVFTQALKMPIRQAADRKRVERIHRVLARLESAP